jgi:hypothetical protein
LLYDIMQSFEMPQLTLTRTPGRYGNFSTRVTQEKRPSPLTLFFIFAANGAAVSFFGQLRYSEIALLLITLFNLGEVIRNTDRRDHILTALFLLSAFAHLAMDAINQEWNSDTANRTGTYLILAVLFLGIRWMIGDSNKRLVAATSGLCISYVVVFIFKIPVPSTAFHIEPWRLGLGQAVTLLVCIAMFVRPKRMLLGLFTLIVLMAMHILLNSRNLLLLTFFTTAVTIHAYTFGHMRPLKLTSARYLRTVAVAVLVLVALQFGVKAVVESNVLPQPMQGKMVQQMSNPYGLLVGARPDVATAIYAVTHRPLTGYGTSTVAPNVRAFFARAGAANFYATDQYNAIYDNLSEGDTRNGTPSHSHLFGAWADAGILAALCWIAVVNLCSRTLISLYALRNPITPMATFVTLTTMWSTLFSPGPIRLDDALMIVTILFADRYLRALRRAGGNPPLAVAVGTRQEACS